MFLHRSTTCWKTSVGLAVAKASPLLHACPQCLTSSWGLRRARGWDRQNRQVPWAVSLPTLLLPTTNSSTGACFGGCEFVSDTSARRACSALPSRVLGARPTSHPASQLTSHKRKSGRSFARRTAPHCHTDLSYMR